MSVTVGVREFRQDLAEYIDQAEPVTATRDGQTVGLFIRVHRDRRAEFDALRTWRSGPARRYRML